MEESAVSGQCAEGQMGSQPLPLAASHQILYSHPGAFNFNDGLMIATALLLVLI